MLASAQRRLADGGAVLMHDALGPGATRAGCENTIALIPLLATAADQQHVTLAPMSSPDTPSMAEQKEGEQR